MTSGESPVEDRCPECGAPRPDGLTCRERFERLLAWEVDDVDLRRAHFLLVASYNLQHPAQFTDEAIDRLRSAFIDHLDRGTPFSEVRRRIGKAAAGAARVLRPEDERHPTLHYWSMTIADVYHGGEPAAAAERVHRWAAAIRSEL